MKRFRSVGMVIGTVTLVAVASVVLVVGARSRSVQAESAISSAVIGQAEISALPAGISEAFATQMYGEQLASQEQIGNLVGKRIKKLQFIKRWKDTNRASVTFKALYTDWSVRTGKMAFYKIGGYWYFAYVTVSGAKNIGYPGLTFQDVNVNVVREMINHQKQDQQLVVNIVNGKVASFVITKVIVGTRAATAKGRIYPNRGASYPAEIGLAKSGANWFIIRFTDYR